MRLAASARIKQKILICIHDQLNSNHQTPLNKSVSRLLLQTAFHRRYCRDCEQQMIQCWIQRPDSEHQVKVNPFQLAIEKRKRKSQTVFPKMGVPMSGVVDALRSSVKHLNNTTVSAHQLKMCTTSQML